MVNIEGRGRSGRRQEPQAHALASLVVNTTERWEDPVLCELISLARADVQDTWCLTHAFNKNTSSLIISNQTLLSNFREHVVF